jgi:hypothetical protein
MSLDNRVVNVFEPELGSTIALFSTVVSATKSSLN